MRVELRWTREHLRAQAWDVRSSKSPNQVLSDVAAVIGSPSSLWNENRRESFGSVIQDVELRGRDAILDRGFSGKVSNDRFVLTPSDDRLHQWWVPKASGRVASVDLESCVSLQVRFIPISGLINIVIAGLLTLVSTVLGIYLVISGTPAGLIAIAVGVGILLWYVYFLRRASTVGKVMTDALVEQLERISRHD